MFKDFLCESDANGADGYVRGRLVIELKGDHEDWLAGFYQALHYGRYSSREAEPLGYTHVVVLAFGFIGLWRITEIPDFAKRLANQTPPLEAPNAAGVANARQTKDKSQQREILDKAQFLFKEPRPQDVEVGKGANVNAHLFAQCMRQLRDNPNEVGRAAITLNNFMLVIEAMEAYFPRPLDAVHAFYDIVNFWDAMSHVSQRESEPGALTVVGGRKKSLQSEPVQVAVDKQLLFQSFIERHYVATNEGSGITTDDYFARFDEVMARIVPEYVKQHGIFFTDLRLARFALWFTDTYFDAGLTDNYVVLDPAGGSGNLVSSWRKHIQHKIVAELQPDLLRIIDRRFRADEEEAMRGFTIVPRVAENRGLNFLDQPATDYYQHLLDALAPEGRTLDKPFAFLLNPPYKNTDERQDVRDANEATYAIDPDILEMTGPDAGNERYLGFLGQITRLALAQVAQYPDFQPVLLVFTPTSWLIPRPTYAAFRARFDQHWQYETGFLTTSNEFFKLNGKWPVAYTIWKWRGGTEAHEGARNTITVRDLTGLKKQDLDKAFSMAGEEDALLSDFVTAASVVTLGSERHDIRVLLPELENGNRSGRQTRYDFSRKKKSDEVGRVVSGFPIADKANHFELSRKCGDVAGMFVGFMDNLTPVRVKQDPLGRMSNQPDRVWFYLDTRVIGLNISKIFNGPPDNRGYCAYDLASARACFTWFGVTKALNNNYPTWFNQYSLWAPDFTRAPAVEAEFYRLCFAFGLAQNRCVVTRFEVDNPVPGAPAVFVDNPLVPGYAAGFWEQVLAPEFVGQPATDAATQLVAAVRAVYGHWATAVCGGQTLPAPELHGEAYFKFFAADAARLTPRAGLVQIRAYATRNTGEAWYPELHRRLARLAELREAVKGEIYRLLVQELRYFS
ncbi:hypothetical protein [Hymenobacter nivis]|uniref:Uncharacterized protein n=1 Tax=Hymenobacter nivis TaxID=1850093 RepID=A0A2Z3GTR7_9BACT|nr:hypothetical protein [Hymenobacter nivis]AWM34435.1 hypothetical protein DDQ68_17575 [Hymenobacter nivis]